MRDGQRCCAASASATGCFPRAPPDRGSIAGFLERRSALGLPIYMGEGGEHGLGWLQTALWVSYEFGLLSDAEVSVVVESDGVVEVTIDGAGLPALLGAGRHELRVTCSSETTIVAAISIEPVSSASLNDTYALADGT